MEKLSGAQLELACKVLLDRYKKCVQRSLLADVFTSADVTAPTRKCAVLFSDLSEFCKELLPHAPRSGGK